MGVKVKKSYLFLLDNYKGEFVQADKPMTDREDGTFDFLRKSIERCLKNSAIRPGTFFPESLGRQAFLNYRNHEQSFLEYASQLARQRFDYKRDSELAIATDLFICEVEIKKGKDEAAIDAIVGLEIACKNGILHTVKQASQGVQTEIEWYNSLVPSVTLKNANLFALNLDDQSVSILENEVVVEGELVHPYADEILGCEMQLSAKEAIQASVEVVREVAAKHELDHLTLVPTMERVVKEVINEGEDLDFNWIANEVIFENEEACQSFLRGMEALGIEKPIKNTQHVKLPPKKMQKIVTDCGIEINIPLEYYTNEDVVKIHQLEDGQLTIELKNLKAIENK